MGQTVRMRNRLLDLPPWLMGIVSGLLYAVLFGLAMRYVFSEEWPTALTAGAVTGPLFGIAMAVINWRAQRALAAVGGDVLTREQRHAAQQATEGGAAPSDPAVRAAALGLARRNLVRAEARAPRIIMAVAAVGVALVSTMQMLDGDSDWSRSLPSLGSAGFVGFYIIHWPRRIRRRIAELSSAPSAPSGDADSAGRPDESVA